MSPKKILLLLSFAAVSAAHAQTAGPSTGGTLVIVPAYGEVRHPNDEAVLTLSVEEHDKSKEAAAERVNRKMKEGTEIVRRADPSARLKTMGYYTVPIYPEGPPPQPLPQQTVRKPPVPLAWRVGQYLEVKTSNLANLPKTAAAAQKVLAISNLNFGLSNATQKKLDDQRIAETYRNLQERIVSIANAMGRKPSDAVLDTVDFEGSGQYAGQAEHAAMRVEMAGARAKFADAMPEPSFEPGETTLQMRLVGKVKFR